MHSSYEIENNLDGRHGRYFKIMSERNRFDANLFLKIKRPVMKKWNNFAIKNNKIMADSESENGSRTPGTHFGVPDPSWVPGPHGVLVLSKIFEKYVFHQNDQIFERFPYIFS